MIKILENAMKSTYRSKIESHYQGVALQSTSRWSIQAGRTGRTKNDSYTDIHNEASRRKGRGQWHQSRETDPRSGCLV